MEEFQDAFNPASQYEQGYLYWHKFLTQQVEYKIKCKELEKISKRFNSNKIKKLYW